MPLSGTEEVAGDLPKLRLAVGDFEGEQLLQALDVLVLDSAALLDIIVQLGASLSQSVLWCRFTCSQSAISVLTLFILFTRSVRTFTACMGWRCS